jgi:hypothetical protein
MGVLSTFNQGGSLAEGFLEPGFGLRSASGKSGAESGGERLANRSRAQRPPPSRRRKPAALAAIC